MSNRPAMPDPPRLQHPPYAVPIHQLDLILTPTDDLPVPHSAITHTPVLPHPRTNQLHDLIERARPQRTDNPIESMHDRQHRQRIREQQAEHVPPEPRQRDEEQQREVEQHEHDATRAAVLQLQDGEGVARLQRAAQHPRGEGVVEVVERQREQPEHLRARALRRVRRGDAQRRGGRVRRVDGLRDEGEILAPLGEVDPRIKAGVQVRQEERDGLAVVGLTLVVDAALDDGRGPAGAGAEVDDGQVLGVGDLIEGLGDEGCCEACGALSLEEREAVRPLCGKGGLASAAEEAWEPG